MTTPALWAEQSGIFRFPGGVYRTTIPHSGMIVKTDSPIKTGADLNGKRWLSQRSTISTRSARTAQTVAVFAQFSGMEPSVVARMTRMIYGTELDPRLIQPLIDAAAKYKVIPQGFDARDFIAPA